MKVEICIERLSLHGVPVASAARLRAALARELRELITAGKQPATLATNAHHRYLHAPGPPFPATSDARIARGLAQSIYRSLERIDRPNPAAAPTLPEKS